MISKSEQRNMHVPGVEIPFDCVVETPPNKVMKDVTSASFEFLGEVETEKFFPTRRNNNKLFQPIIESFRQESSILIRAVTYINSYLDFELQFGNKFRYVYNYNLNDLGQYELRIYIVFYQNETQESHQTLYQYFHRIKINEGSIKDGNGEIVPVKYIDKVKIFLVNQNPKTSRGTETTVQGG
jgi:hypothetical protein